ncbi:unnamed protein product [Cladocopium goreaui]|uniref:Ribosomal RNA large subunit methyltransferase J (23S rRNA (Adenine(2030)-N6)-methyltransferase) (23S rRNA m6A2030 methyltransferase) (ORFJ) n=1 Tax=Cladocopium goreaui TaxID=2562237 RepID=A0A9P1FF97_9DINO|nr:unnamed protein product [Cladocopium goreaui]
MRAVAVPPDLVTVNAAIAACSLRGRWTESLGLLAQLAEGSLGDVITVGSTVMACQKSGHWEVALALLRFAAGASIELSVTACNAAVSTCEKAAQWEAAVALLVAMEEAILDSDCITYNAVIGACDKGLQWLMALQLLRRMTEIQLQHDRISFYTAIHACESCGNWPSAQELLAEMLELGIQDGLGADNLNRREYLHAFQAGDPIDCFKHVVLLSFWQRLAVAGDPLTFVDAHAGAGVYDLLQGAATFHRNYQDGIQHLDAIANEHNCTTVVMRYLQSLRYFNRQKHVEGGHTAWPDQLRFYLGSSGLLNLWLRPQDKAVYFEASDSVMQHLKQHLGGVDVSTRGHCAELRLLQADSYRWLLDMNETEAFGRGLVLLDPPYDSVNSYHVWNLFIIKHIRHTWPLTSVALWYPIIDSSQTENFHTRLAELGEDILVAEIEVERPHEQQQSSAGMALLAAPPELEHVLECELSALAQMLASSILAGPYQRNVRASVFWLRDKKVAAGQSL